MKLLFQLASILLLVSVTNGRIRKRLISNGDRTNNTQDSFHINVSAGYGVGSDGNSSKDASSPVHPYYFQEKKDHNKTGVRQDIDQISLPSIPRYTYQVSEPSVDLQSKSSNSGKTFVQHSRVRPNLNEIQNVLNDLENGEAAYGPSKSLSKIVEVVRVPAIYELHLQSDNHNPQRYITLNPWASKPQSNGGNRYYGHQQRQPNYGAYRNVQNVHYANSQPQILQSYNVVQHPVTANVPYSQRPSDSSVWPHRSQQPQLSLFVDNHSIRDQPKVPPKIVTSLRNTYQNYHSQQSLPGNSQQFVLKDYYRQNSFNQNPQLNQHADVDISHDYYRKPQAIHEVPAPVLNIKPAPYPKQKSIPVYTSSMNASPVYGNHVTTPRPAIIIPGYTTSNQQSYREKIPVPLENNVHPLTNQQTYQEHAQGPLDNIQMQPVTTTYNPIRTQQGHVDSVPNTFYYMGASSNIGIQESSNLEDHSGFDGPSQVYSNDNKYLDVNGAMVGYVDQNLIRPETPNYFQYYQRPQIFSNGEQHSHGYSGSDYDSDDRHTSATSSTNHYQIVSKQKQNQGSQYGGQLFLQNLAPDVNMLIVRSPNQFPNMEPQNPQNSALHEVTQSHVYNNFESMRIKPRGEFRPQGRPGQPDLIRPLGPRKHHQHPEPMNYIIIRTTVD